VEIQEFRAIGEALAIGLLIGGERYRGRTDGEKSFAGLRTLAIISLLGAVGALLAVPMYTLAMFVAVVALLGLGYAREEGESLGGTTEVAALLAFWLGFATRDHEVIALATAVALVVLLASKKVLHRFVAERITDVEFLDTLKFLVVVIVVWPLLPNRAFGPYDAINPSQIWALVILVSTISYSGYVLVRAFGGSRGLQISSLVGGIVSTTAVTMSLAHRARENPGLARLCGVTGVLANAVQLPRLLVLLYVVDRPLATMMAAPLLGGFAAGAGGAWLLARVRRHSEDDAAEDVTLQNPYSFTPALKFALLLGVVFVISKVMGEQFGEGGVFVTAAVTGLADASAISLSVADMAHGGTLSAASAGWAVLIATAANAVLKCGIAAVNGTWNLVFWLAGGFVTMICVAAGLLMASQGMPW
jgi:uncharacterized membrane protein (DUF4010 family)